MDAGEGGGEGCFEDGEGEGAGEVIVCCVSVVVLSRGGEGGDKRGREGEARTWILLRCWGWERCRRGLR